MSARLLPIGWAADLPRTDHHILIKLIDVCRDDGSRIFISTSALARDAKCHKRTAQKVLRSFVERGLITVVSPGGRGPRDTTEYQLDIAVLQGLSRQGSDSKKPPIGTAGCSATPPLQTNKGGGGCTKRAARDAPKGGVARHPIPYSPLNDPFSEREWIQTSQGKAVPDEERKGGASSACDDLPENTPDLQSAIALWPTGRTDNPARVREAWQTLSPADQADAVSAIPAYLADLRASGRTFTCGLPRYLRDRLFEPFVGPDQPTSAITMLIPKTAEWWVVFWTRKATGERIRAMLDMAKAGTGYPVRTGSLPSLAKIAAHVPILVGSKPYQAWASLLRGESLFLNDFCCGPRIWVPGEWPPGREPPQAKASAPEVLS